MVAYLAFLLFLGAWGIGNWTLLGRGILILSVYSVLDLVIGYFREGKWILPSSAWISGLILALVLSPTAPTAAVLLAPVLASLSKQFLRVRRMHVVNPAAFALILLGAWFPGHGMVSWWGAAWGILPLVIIALSGIVTIIRVKRWKITLAFSAVYLIGSAALILSHGGQITDLRTLILDGTFAFFATVMLIEPVTTAYQPAWLRTAFGTLVALLVLIFSLPQFTLQLPDAFLVALLVGNAAATAARRLIRR